MPRSTAFIVWVCHSVAAVFCAVVNIDGGGILGLLDIRSVSPSTANFKFQALQSFKPDIEVSQLTIAIHSLPPVYQGTCSEEEVGSLYDPTNAYSEENYNKTCGESDINCAVGDLRNRLGAFGSGGGGVNTTFPDGTSLFSGPNSVVGRSLVIYDGSGQPVTCAVIRNQTAGDLSLREVTLEARFPAPVAGVVTFRQLVDDRTSMTYDTQILVDLFSNDGSPTVEGCSWYLVKGQATDPSSCRDLAEKPLKMTCTEYRCFSGYLVDKHGFLTIPRGKGQRLFFIDSNMPLDDISGMSLVVSDPELTRFTCATIHPQLGVIATFDDDVKGYISILPQVVGSVLRVNLTGLAGQAGGYHVHRFPVSNGDCGTTGGHFNPFNVVNQSTIQDGSSDQFEVGDLSGLFGSLVHNDSVVFTTFSRNLLSEGLHGILGRSIVIHRADQSRWQCATLEPLPRHGEQVTRHAAVARFKDTYQGYVKLTQYKIGRNTFTGTVVEIDIRQDGNATVDHNWHVHQAPAAAYDGINEGNCANHFAGGHYNPQGVDLTTRYSDDCRPENQLRCELGDMSGKHGKYTIHSLQSSEGRRLMYDSWLPLMGPDSVMHRSVVIHAANSGGGRIACGTLYPEGTQGLSVTFRKPSVVDAKDVQRALAQTLTRVDSDVQFVHLAVDESKKCVSVTFAVPDAIVDAYNCKHYASYLAARDGTFGSYVVENDCLEWPNVDEDALAVVNINGDGIVGQLDIDGMLDGNVSFRFRSLKVFDRSTVDDVAVAIHELPPLYRGSCSESEVGPIYDPTEALVNTDYENRCRSDTVECAVGDLKERLGIVSLGRRVTVFPGRRNFLRGPDSVVGRSLVVYNVSTGQPITCSLITRRHVGTVESVREISLGAKLLAPIAGKVTFTQGTNDQTKRTYETQILVDVFANDLSVPAGKYSWHLIKGQFRDMDECRKVAKTIKTVGCTRNNSDDCLFADLTGKQGVLTVHWGRGHRVLYTDTNLPLRNVTDMTLVIYDVTGSNVSCVSVTSRVGTRAQFNDEVKGAITCIPSHGGSSVEVQLSNLQGRAGGYHVHRYPVTNGDCSSTGGHLNPFNVTHSPPTGQGSDDQFEVGDLSGIFGSLAGRDSVSFHRFAPNVHCDRVLGRSIVIHYTDGSRWQCASLEPVLADGRKGIKWTRHSAVAHFNGHYDGYVQLTQWERGDASFFTDTVVDVNIHVHGNMSVGHKFHIHQKPVAGFAGLDANNCHANFTGGHYNPLGIDLKTDYSDECNEHSQLRCEIGDLSSKHGTYAFYSKEKNGRRLTSDGLLPLTGQNSVMLRSIVFHAAKGGAARVACATLYPEGHRSFAVTFSSRPMIDTSDLRLSIAHGIGVSPDDIRYLDVDVDHSGQCASATFALPERVASSLEGDDFVSALTSNNGTFGSYVVNSTCVTSVSAGVTSGTQLALLSLWVMTAAVWLSAIVRW